MASDSVAVSLQQVPAIPSLYDPQLRDVCVWGYGREGKATVQVLAALRPDIKVSVVEDTLGSTALDQPMPSNVVRVINEDSATNRSALLQSQFVVRSPGISAYSEGASELRSRDIVNVNSTAWWMATTRGAGVVGITGTKGKSTSSTVLAHLLRALGVDVRLGGNMGEPVISWLLEDSTNNAVGASGLASPDVDVSSEWTTDRTLSVVELSSFQITDFQHSPEFCLFTSLFSDHLDWHGDQLRYEDDKFNYLRHRSSTTAVLNADSSNLVAAYRRNNIDQLVKDIRWFGDSHQFYSVGTEVFCGDVRVIQADRNPLLGHHNANNLAGVFAMLDALRIDVLGNLDALGDALESFEPLQHRLKVVAEARGVTYVDDGLSTNADGTTAALDSFPGRPIYVLLGGYDRGIDYDGLASAIVARAEPTVVLAIPDNGQRIADAIRRASVVAPTAVDHASVVAPTAVDHASVVAPTAIDHVGAVASTGVDHVGAVASTGVDHVGAVAPTAVEVVMCDSLESAVAIAVGRAEPGSVVLLSPAAPSFGRFTDYRHRSAVFTQAVSSALSK